MAILLNNFWESWGGQPAAQTRIENQLFFDIFCISSDFCRIVAQKVNIFGKIFKLWPRDRFGFATPALKRLQIIEIIRKIVINNNFWLKIQLFPNYNRNLKKTRVKFKYSKDKNLQMNYKWQQIFLIFVSCKPHRNISILNFYKNYFTSYTTLRFRIPGEHLLQTWYYQEERDLIYRVSDEICSCKS